MAGFGYALALQAFPCASSYADTSRKQADCKAPSPLTHEFHVLDSGRILALADDNSPCRECLLCEHAFLPPRSFDMNVSVKLVMPVECL